MIPSHYCSWAPGPAPWGMGCESDRDRDKGGRPGRPWLNWLREEKGTRERGKAGRTDGRYHEGRGRRRREKMPGRSRAVGISQLADPRCLTSSKGPSQVTSCDSVHPSAATGLACDSTILPPPDRPSPGGTGPAVHSAHRLASWTYFRPVSLPPGHPCWPKSPPPRPRLCPFPWRRAPHKPPAGQLKHLASQLWAAAFSQGDGHVASAHLAG